MPRDVLKCEVRPASEPGCAVERGSELSGRLCCSPKAEAGSGKQKSCGAGGSVAAEGVEECGKLRRGWTVEPTEEEYGSGLESSPCNAREAAGARRPVGLVAELGKNNCWTGICRPILRGGREVV